MRVTKWVRLLGAGIGDEVGVCVGEGVGDAEAEDLSAGVVDEVV